MTKENGNSVEKERGNWGNQLEFLLSCLGYAVGLGNVWRFPYLVYKNGGATFLIPYAIMLLCAGLPMFFMELALGQYASYGPNILFQKMSPLFSGVGWAMVAISLLTCAYYNLILAWGFFYVFASFSSELPWGQCNNHFNTAECYAHIDAISCRNLSLHYYNKSCLSTEEYCHIAGLQTHNLTHCLDVEQNEDDPLPVNGVLHRSTPSEEYFQNRMLGIAGTSWEDMGSMRWEIVGCLALAWIVVGLTIMKGIRSSGKVVYFTATFPYVMLIVLFIRGITLEGSYKGIEYYILKTDWTRLTEVEVWSDAASQIFYSLGVSFGGLMTLASYNRFSNNCMRDAIIIAFSNCLTSVFTGLVIFTVLGFLANELGVEVKDVVTSGSGLVFVVYPAAINLMPLPHLWSVLFFFMLITVGLDTQFAMMETVTTALCDQFKSLRAHKTLVVFVTCIVTYLLGLTMCLEGGIYMFELFTWQAAGLSLIIVAVFQVITVQYVYGFKKFMENIREMDIKMPRFLYCYWAATWCFMTPLSLGVIFCFSIYYLVPVYWGTYVFPSSIQLLGWFICATSVILIPLGAIYVFCRRDKSIQSLTQATSDYCPAHVRNLLVLRETKVSEQDVFRYVYQNDGCSDLKEIPPRTTNTAASDNTSGNYGISQPAV